MSSPQKATMQVIPLEEDTDKPLLASFSQNVPGGLEDQDFTLLRKRARSQLFFEGDHVDYVAKSIKSAENASYVLGFYNEEKNSLRLVAVDRTFNFERVIKQEAPAELVGMNAAATGIEHKELMVEHIGTKKSKKIFSQMRNKVIEESRIQSAGDIKNLLNLQAGVLKSEIEDSRAQEFEKEWARKRTFLPDFNLSAKSAAKVYNVKSIMTDQEAAEIKPEYIDDPTYLQAYIVDLYNGIDWPKLAAKTAVDKKKQLMYLNYLIRMRRMRKVEQSHEELSHSLGIPLFIIQNVLERFYEPMKGEKEDVKFVRPKALDVKMLCYILILNLIICSYRLEGKGLMKALKLEEAKLTLIAKEIGCTVAKKDDNVVIRLRKLKIDPEANAPKRRARN